MAKRVSAQSRGRSGPAKSMVSKKAEIEKLIRAAKDKPSAGRKSFFRKQGSHGPQHPLVTPVSASVLDKAVTPDQDTRRLEPKAVVPGLPDLRHLVLDRDHEENPRIALVRLPFEPATPRSLRYSLDRQYLPNPGFVRRGRFPFFDLPGELRNKIYDLAIVNQEYFIDWVKGTHKSKKLTYHIQGLFEADGHVPKLKALEVRRLRSDDCERRQRSQKQIPVVESLKPGPAAMLFVSKTMHLEVASVFYSKSLFVFYGLGTLRYFLDHLTPIAKTSITNVELYYRAYGNPTFTDHQWVKERHDRTWENLCWRVADECVSLTNLSLVLTLNKSPTSFAPFDRIEDTDIGAHWIKPLWAFQDVGIQRCWGQIRCSAVADTVLEVESWNVRKEILGEAWDEKVEARRTAYGITKKRKRDSLKKGMVLRLRADGGLETA